MKRVIDFYNRLIEPATQIEEKHGISAMFIIAQAALESGWGKSAIGNNLFGIKAGKSWGGQRQLVKTTEYLRNANAKFPVLISRSANKNSRGKYKYIVKDYFRDYDSMEDCLINHAKVLMKPHFKAAIGIIDPYEYAVAIQSGRLRYATADNYAESIRAVVKTIKKYCKISDTPVVKKAKIDVDEYNKRNPFHLISPSSDFADANRSISLLIDTFAKQYVELREKFPDVGIGDTDTDQAVRDVLYEKFHYS